MSPKISIIIPVFNREELIKATIDSIKQQSYCDFECLIIDDGSTDNTIELMKQVVENDSRFKILNRQSSYLKGPAGCRNMGLDIAIGEYIQFFDSDDLMHPDHLKLKIEAYSENIDLVVCKLGEFKDDYKMLFSISDIDDKGKLIAHITGEVNYYLPGPMWKRKTISDDRFQTDIKIYEDLLFNLINRKKCSNIHLLNEPLIYYRRHEYSTTGIATKDVEILEQKRLAWKYMYKVISDDKLNDIVYDKKVRSVFFDYSCLNLYYILCQKSLRIGYRQLGDIFFYTLSLRHFAIIIKLISLSPLAYFLSKGYKLYKVKT